MSLDGVFESPSWTFEFGFDPKMGELIGALCAGCSAILLGRTTYEMFEPAWSTRTAEDDPGAPFFNDTTKYVVSSTLTETTWRNSQIVGPYDPDAIRRLKDESDGNLYVSGSGMLVRAMLADGLIDELHLFVYPVTLGSGARLFGEGDASVRLAVAATDTYDNGVVHLTTARRPDGSSYALSVSLLGPARKPSSMSMASSGEPTTGSPSTRSSESLRPRPPVMNWASASKAGYRRGSPASTSVAIPRPPFST
jgi:dihydrofolate reductase